MYLLCVSFDYYMKLLRLHHLEILVEHERININQEYPMVETQIQTSTSCSSEKKKVKRNGLNLD